MTGLLNLGCGERHHAEWTNADLMPAAADVLPIDLRRPLPFESGSFRAVYASHVIEHMSPKEARRFVMEIHRVLTVGGVVRLVVPDLEGIVRGYLASLDSVDATGSEEDRWRHRWMTVELLDQLVRTRSGGAMRRWWSCDPVPCRDLIESRLGAEATTAIADLARIPRVGPRVTADAILDVPTATPREAVRFAGRGEKHQWMYDRVSLADVLTGVGFGSARRVSAVDSSIPDFARYELDADATGRPHKPDSLFMEAVRA